MRFPASGLRRSKPQRKKPARQLGLEALEDRNLLSASAPSAAIELSGLNVNPSQYNSGDILVQFRPAAVANGAVPALAGTSVGQKLDLVPGLYEIKLDPGVSVGQALA